MFLPGMLSLGTEWALECSCDDLPSAQALRPFTNAELESKMK